MKNNIEFLLKEIENWEKVADIYVGLIEDIKDQEYFLLKLLLGSLIANIILTAIVLVYAFT